MHELNVGVCGPCCNGNCKGLKISIGNQQKYIMYTLFIKIIRGYFNASPQSLQGK